MLFNHFRGRNLGLGENESHVSSVIEIMLIPARVNPKTHDWKKSTSNIVLVQTMCKWLLLLLFQHRVRVFGYADCCIHFFECSERCISFTHAILCLPNFTRLHLSCWVTGGLSCNGRSFRHVFETCFTLKSLSAWWTIQFSKSFWNQTSPLTDSRLSCHFVRDHKWWWLCCWACSWWQRLVNPCMQHRQLSTREFRTLARSREVSDCRRKEQCLDLVTWKQSWRSISLVDSRWIHSIIDETILFARRRLLAFSLWL